MLFRGPPFASSSASVFCWRGFFLDSPTPVALLAGSCGQLPRSCFLSVGWAPLCLLSSFACGLLVFSAWWTVPFLWLCLGLRVSSPFHSPRPRSHSLSLCLSCSSLSPLGFYWLGLVSVLATFVAWIVPRHLIVAYLLVSLRGVRLFCFAGRTSSPFFWFVRGVRCSSWLSPLHSARFWFVVFSVACGWVGALLPSLRPCTQSLSLWPVGCFPVSSVTLHSCVLSWSLGFSIPWQFPRPGLLFPGSHTLQLPPPWYSRWHLDPAFCSSRVLHPTLSHVFATAFPTVQLVPRFSLLLF